MKFAWRSPKFFEEPGLFFIVAGKSLCVFPVMRARK